jgi:hypothetical protein
MQLQLNWNLDLIELNSNSIKEERDANWWRYWKCTHEYDVPKKSYKKLKSEKIHASFMNTSVAYAIDPSVNSPKPKFH